MPTMQSKSDGDVEETSPETPGTAGQACIYRAFSNDRGGHYLHVSINRNGKMYQKYFPEKRCGGEQDTMKLAQAWRDTIIAKHPPMSLGRFCSILRTNNTSGIAGVSRIIKRSRSKDGRLPERIYWRASIPMVGGTVRLCSLPVKELGEEGARLRAIDARTQGLIELENIAFREKQQPHPVSTKDDVALLEAKLREPAERRARQIAERVAKRAQDALRAADKLAQALATEEEALARAAKRSGEQQYIARYASLKGTSLYWQVKFQRHGVIHRKSFSDSVYGGAAEALLAARAWRDQLFGTLPIASKAAFVARIKATNTSGVAGVTRTQKVSKGEIFHGWVAYSPQMKGVPRRSKWYSIEKYGDEEAFALAVKAREAFVAELSEVEFLQHPAARQMKRALLTK